MKPNQIRVLYHSIISFRYLLLEILPREFEEHFEGAADCFSSSKVRLKRIQEQIRKGMLNFPAKADKAMGINTDPFPEIGEATANVGTLDFQNLYLKELEEVNVQMHVANQIASQKDTRSSPANGQSFAAQKDDSRDETLDGDPQEAAVIKKMCPKCKSSYKWLKWLPIDKKQHYEDVWICLMLANNYNRRPYPTGPTDLKQQPFLVRPPANQTAFQKDTRSSPASGQNFATQKDDSKEETLYGDSLEAAVMKRMCSRCRLGCKWFRPPNHCRMEGNYPKMRPEVDSSYGIGAKDWSPRSVSNKMESNHHNRRPVLCSRQGIRAKQCSPQIVSKLASKAERASSATELVSSLVPGVPNCFVMQNKPKQMPTQKSDFGDKGKMIKPLVISKTQKRRIQRKYTQYQKNLKKSGESSSLAQSKGQAEEKESPKLAPQIKRSASREQLAKVHAELRAKERTSLIGLEKAFMESEDEIDKEGELGQKKVLALMKSEDETDKGNE
ncbi:uncharacterized protein LOC114320035 isoform X1 [Camellia sinensis]|uniref:uncharacterized protein LOC114320035 isoform X1 n=2 Tax=Camellia sinensis TaxID=4442 RepID=UPI0010355FC2|nr:uncharacterized protein LOC114320035 isoform X1 [Camellia sinensis]